VLSSPRGSLLLALLLRVPLRFNLADVCLFNLLVPVAGALALLLVAGDMSSLHGVLLSVGDGWMTIVLFFALALAGSWPCSPSLSALSRWLSRAQRHRHVVIILYFN
jgi:hypothetical protein